MKFFIHTSRDYPRWLFRSERGATLATAETYAELAAGKAVFINFFAPYVRACAHAFPSIPTPPASTRRAADPRAMTNFMSQQILKGILPMTNDNTIFLLSSNAPTRRGREQLATPFSACARRNTPTVGSLCPRPHPAQVVRPLQESRPGVGKAIGGVRRERCGRGAQDGLHGTHEQRLLPRERCDRRRRSPSSRRSRSRPPLDARSKTRDAEDYARRAKSGTLTWDERAEAEIDSMEEGETDELKRARRRAFAACRHRRSAPSGGAAALARRAEGRRTDTLPS